MQWDRTGWDGIDVNEITVQGDRGYFCSRNSAAFSCRVWMRGFKHCLAVLGVKLY